MFPIGFICNFLWVKKSHFKIDELFRGVIGLLAYELMGLVFFIGCSNVLSLGYHDVMSIHDST